MWRSSFWFEYVYYLLLARLLGTLLFFFTWFRLLMHQNRVNVYKNLPFLSVGVQNELVKYGKESNNRDRLMTKLILWMILIWTIVIAHIRFNYDLVLQAVLLLLLLLFFARRMLMSSTILICSIQHFVVFFPIVHIQRLKLSGYS